MNGNSPLIWILVILGVAVSISVLIYMNSPQNPSIPGIPDGVACTQEALLCPDGSAVGRSGPRCEFSACPGE